MMSADPALALATAYLQLNGYFLLTDLSLIALTIPAALADDNLGPCNNSGEPGNSDYAQHHIVPADIGGGGHVPGTHHGFSLCNTQPAGSSSQPAPQVDVAERR